MTSLTVRKLSKRFTDSPTSGLALNDVDLAVEAGELLVLLGPSGCGKTTLLRSIAGLNVPTAGQIHLGDILVSDIQASIDVPTNRRNIGMVFQNFALWPHMTIAENVAYPLKSRGWDRARIAGRVRDMLALVRCGDFADRLPSSLSGGQQQRVALARAIAAQPALILFDEPLSNLDALLRIELRAQLRMIHRETGFTGVFVTHDQVEAMSLGSRVAVMNRGRVEQIGTPEDVYCRPSSEFVAEFMGMSNRLVVAADALGPSVPRVGSGCGDVLAARFRPEDVALGRRLDPSGSDEPPAIVLADLPIVDRAFHGERVEYGLSHAGTLLKASLPRDHGLFAVGEVVCSRIAPSRICAFAA